MLLNLDSLICCNIHPGTPMASITAAPMQQVDSRLLVKGIQQGYVGTCAYISMPIYFLQSETIPPLFSDSRGEEVKLADLFNNYAETYVDNDQRIARVGNKTTTTVKVTSTYVCVYLQPSRGLHLCLLFLFSKKLFCESALGTVSINK